MSGTNNAHNTIMQIGATGGLVLLLAYVLLLVFIAGRAIIALRKSDEKILVSGLFSIWIAFQVQSLVSIDQIGLVVWGWAVAGCLVSLSYIDSTTIDTKSSKDKRNKLDSELNPKLVFILIGLLPSVLLIPTLHNEISLRGKLVALVSSADLESLKSNGLAVVEVASKSNEPELRLRAMDYLLRAELNQDALSLVEKNIMQFPNSFESWNSIAEIYERLGQKEKAITYRAKSVELDPLNSVVKKLLEEDMASN
jgi:tetratricopeptide (TPR) repeat protein